MIMLRAFWTALIFLFLFVPKFLILLLEVLYQKFLQVHEIKIYSCRIYSCFGRRTWYWKECPSQLLRQTDSHFTCYAATIHTLHLIESRSNLYLAWGYRKFQIHSSLPHKCIIVILIWIRLIKSSLVNFRTVIIRISFFNRIYSWILRKYSDGTEIL